MAPVDENIRVPLLLKCRFTEGARYYISMAEPKEGAEG